MAHSCLWFCEWRPWPRDRVETMQVSLHVFLIPPVPPLHLLLHYHLFPVMLMRELIIPRMDWSFKTIIVFLHDKGISILFKVLSAFIFRNISLMKIESWLHRNHPIRLIDDENMGIVIFGVHVLHGFGRVDGWDCHAPPTGMVLFSLAYWALRFYSW